MPPMSAATRKGRSKRPSTKLSDVACLIGLVAITVAFWTMVVVGLVVLI